MSEDGWNERGGHHLLLLIRKLYGRGRKVPGRPPSYESMRFGRQPDHGAGFAHNVGLLVGAKNAWVAAMREASYAGAVPAGDKQRALWNELMAKAAASFVEGE